MPRYSYRYAFEMEKLLQQHAEEIERFPHLHILSAGCGPCTDLLGFASFNKKLNKPFLFNGIDLNSTWTSIHKNLKQRFKSNYALQFHYEDILEIVSRVNPGGKKLHFNIVTFQYVLSDLGKYNSREEIKLFFEKFYDRIIRHLPSGALIILNDINHKELSRDIFALLEEVLPEKGYSVEKYYFKNDVETSRDNYFCMELK